MQILRTPDSRFENLPGWSYPPHYAEITDAATGQDLRMAPRCFCCMASPVGPTSIGT
jgi:hypothetical protein